MQGIPGHARATATAAACSVGLSGPVRTTRRLRVRIGWAPTLGAGQDRDYLPLTHSGTCKTCRPLLRRRVVPQCAERGEWHMARTATRRAAVVTALGLVLAACGRRVGRRTGRERAGRRQAGRRRDPHLPDVAGPAPAPRPAAQLHGRGPGVRQRLSAADAHRVRLQPGRQAGHRARPRPGDGHRPAVRGRQDVDVHAQGGRDLRGRHTHHLRRRQVRRLAHLRDRRHHRRAAVRGVDARHSEGRRRVQCLQGSVRDEGQ